MPQDRRQLHQAFYAPDKPLRFYAITPGYDQLPRLMERLVANIRVASEALRQGQYREMSLANRRAVLIRERIQEMFATVPPVDKQLQRVYQMPKIPLPEFAGLDMNGQRGVLVASYGQQLRAITQAIRALYATPELMTTAGQEAGRGRPFVLSVMVSHPGLLRLMLGRWFKRGADTDLSGKQSLRLGRDPYARVLWYWNTSEAEGRARGDIVFQTIAELPEALLEVERLLLQLNRLKNFLDNQDERGQPIGTLWLGTRVNVDKPGGYRNLIGRRENSDMRRAIMQDRNVRRFIVDPTMSQDQFGI